MKLVWKCSLFLSHFAVNLAPLKFSSLEPQRKKYSSGPRYWNVPVLVNTGTFLVYQYCPKMWYLSSLEHASVIQKLTILEHKNGLVLSNTHVPVSGTWSLLFPFIFSFFFPSFPLFSLFLSLYLFLFLSFFLSFRRPLWWPRKARSPKPPKIRPCLYVLFIHSSPYASYFSLFSLLESFNLYYTKLKVVEDAVY